LVILDRRESFLREMIEKLRKGLINGEKKKYFITIA